MVRRTRAFVALGAMTAITCATSTTPASAQGAPVCGIETYEWIGDARMFVGGPADFSTGVTIPPVEPGQTLAILEAVYDSYDEYPVGQVPSRAEADQANETWRLEIGGVLFGSPTADLPDTVAEGARDDYYGELSGTLGTGPITGGEITGIHSSLFGFTESPNSVIARGLDIRVARCSGPPPTTPPGPPTTPPGPPATPPEPPDTGLTTLPATGDVSQRPLTTIGAFLLAIGAGLVVASRRSASRHRA